MRAISVVSSVLLDWRRRARDIDGFLLAIMALIVICAIELLARFVGLR
jgi:hypothetical protein